MTKSDKRDLELCYKPQRSIQNPVKHLRWSDLQKYGFNIFTRRSILDVWKGSE